MKKGVFLAKKKDGSIYYRASITYRNKHISLGSYNSESLAHAAYLCASKLIENTNIMIADYTPSEALSFEKWVVLCNFRDNNLYFSTPIYVRNQFFYYYFEKEQFFLFSMEDLFFYASHKISKRGGHYFVADYGMQINMMSRYGIKSYAVEGRDYLFRNGNPYDFRYENIEILNQYHGISQLTTDIGIKWKAQIHIRGYVQIGIYDSAIEAAIAYNKAVDELKKIGIHKKYPINSLDDLSPKKYADLYHNLIISKTITAQHSQ